MTTRRSSSTRGARRGYTVLEVMMALTVLALLGSTVVMLQKVTLVGNNHARSIAVANAIAASWVERLRTDADMWNAPPNLADDLADTRWLKNVNGGWFIPVEVPYVPPGLAASPDGDIFGDFLFAGDKKAVPYCTNLRLTPLGTEYPGIIRAEIRVFWNAGIANVDCTELPQPGTLNPSSSLTLVTNISWSNSL